MAISKTLFTPILFSLILLLIDESNARMDNTMVESLSPSQSPSPSPSPLPTNMDCGGACDERCKLSSRPNLCKRACETCCEQCNCVPSGTSGNYEECPCYANMTTHGGRHKCP